MANHVELEFGPDFQGTLKASHGTLTVGMEEGEFRPYDLLLGGLGGCFYSTFLDIARKMKLKYDKVTFVIDGVKREDVPTTLKTVELQITVYNAEEPDRFGRAMDLAAKYCSIHETIAQVATVTHTLSFA